MAAEAAPNEPTIPRAEVDGSMARVIRAGLKRYQPVLAGVPLEVEDGDPEVTIRNVDRIVTDAPGRRIVGLVVGQSGNLVIVLSDGILYSASGFGVDTRAKREATAFYLANIEEHPFSDDFQAIFQALEALPPGFEGIIPLPLKSMQPETEPKSGRNRPSGN